VSYTYFISLRDAVEASIKALAHLIRCNLVKNRQLPRCYPAYFSVHSHYSGTKPIYLVIIFKIFHKPHISGRTVQSDIITYIQQRQVQPCQISYQQDHFQVQKQNAQQQNKYRIKKKKKREFTLKTNKILSRSYTLWLQNTPVVRPRLLPLQPVWAGNTTVKRKRFGIL